MRKTLLCGFAVSLLMCLSLGAGLVLPASGNMRAEKGNAADVQNEEDLHKKQLEEYWNKAYSKKRYLIGTEPDEFLAEQLSTLRPGTVLFPGEGEGRNAVYAAGLGWNVDAFDISVNGEKKALKLAAKRGVSINYWIADFEDPHLPPKKYDVVAIIDLPVFPSVRRKGFAEMRRCLKPGGTLIYEGYLPKDESGVWTSRNELIKAFAGFKFKTLETNKFIRYHEGRDHIDFLIRMVARK